MAGFEPATTYPPDKNNINQNQQLKLYIQNISEYKTALSPTN